MVVRTGKLCAALSLVGLFSFAPSLAHADDLLAEWQKEISQIAKSKRAIVTIEDASVYEVEGKFHLPTAADWRNRRASWHELTQLYEKQYALDQKIAELRRANPPAAAALQDAVKTREETRLKIVALEPKIDIGVVLSIQEKLDSDHLEALKAQKVQADNDLDEIKKIYAPHHPKY